MKEGYLQIAKKYILYREQRAKVRQVEAKKVTPRLIGIWLKILKLKPPPVKKNLSMWRPYDLKLRPAAKGLTTVSADKILMESFKKLFQRHDRGADVSFNIMAAKSFLEVEPDYAFAAARLLLFKEYQEAIGYDISFEE